MLCISPKQLLLSDKSIAITSLAQFLHSLARSYTRNCTLPRPLPPRSYTRRDLSFSRDHFTKQENRECLVKNIASFLTSTKIDPDVDADMDQ